MIRFGTGGWRAIIADEFTKANVQLLTYALSNMMRDEGKEKSGVCIGYDRRFLSREAAHWAAEVFAAQGVFCRVIDREAPTPLIMFTVKQLNTEYGMAITASHNPAVYNGIKLFTSGGRDASEAVTRKLEGYIDRHERDLIPLMDYEEAKARSAVYEINPLNDYIDSILALVDTEAIKKARLKIALDPMYGVSQTSLRTILLTTRCEVDVIHERHDTLFGGRLPAPNPETLNSLSDFVVEHKSDLGIATDGDADRIGVIDDAGAFVHPNKLLVLLYYYLLQYRGWHGPVVRNNSTTHLLDRVAKAFHETCYEVPVGFKHISSKMEETGAVIGGESSGGLTVRGHIRGKDGIYAAALLVEMMAKTGKRLSDLYFEITAKFGDAYTAEADIELNRGNKQTLMDRLFLDKQLPEFPFKIERISYLDGCKVYFENGGFMVARFSGTEPLLRLCCEMSTQKDADACLRLFEEFLKMQAA
ncbi:MAG TPA: phosphoglucomutase/phosphomannomutase family protein [Clostridia bacterium]|nr:phosphoglucomutase/phosphomannomutase family protein [Clostridia bacterium]